MAADEWLQKIDAAERRGVEAARAVLAWWSGVITREQLDAELARVRAS